MGNHAQHSYHHVRDGRRIPKQAAVLPPCRAYVETYVAEHPGHYPGRKRFVRAMEQVGIAKDRAWRAWETLRKERIAQYGPVIID